MRVTASLGLVIAAACGHAPPPRPPPAELTVSSPADLAGTWVADDYMDWGYRLTIDKTGALDQFVDRGKLGTCEQKGTLAAGAAPKQFAVTFTRNECNRDSSGAPLTLTVVSFTGKVLSIAITGDGTDEHHVYHAAPSQ